MTEIKWRVDGKEVKLTEFFKKLDGLTACFAVGNHQVENEKVKVSEKIVVAE